MRTSGAGGRDSLMTIVPLVMLGMVIIWVAGGPRAGLAWVDSFLRALVQWVQDVVR